jgi:hypothetical protein
MKNRFNVKLKPTIIILILWFVLTPINEPFTQSKRLAIHTVFLPNENALFLEEWVNYHLELGFDELYLYDNTGSVGRRGSTNDTNKYNINFNEINDTEYVNKVINKIKANKHVHFIKWQPTDENNNIVYGYNESVNDYITKYQHKNDWTAFIDIDEFIFLNGKNIKDLIINMDNKNYNKIIIKQRKYEDRYCNLDKNVIDIHNMVDVNTDNWAYKNICKNKDLIKMNDKKTMMHNIPLKNMNSYKCDVDMMRFNHYNVNKKQVKWMHEWFKTNKPFKITKDTSLKDTCSAKILDNNIEKKYNKQYYKENRHKFCSDIF